MPESTSAQKHTRRDLIGACVLALLPMILYFGVCFPLGVVEVEDLHNTVWLANIVITGLGALRISRIAIGVVRDRACAVWKRTACFVLGPIVWFYWWALPIMFRLLLS